MNKKYIFGVLALLLLLVSCDSMERKEHRLIDAMTGENVEEANAAYEEFSKWLMQDKATMDYDFAYMREKLTDVHIVQSSDSIIRCYSWETERCDTSRSYANVMQWRIGDNMAGYIGSLERLIANRRVDYTIPFTLAHTVDTIIKVEHTQPVVYLLVQSYTSGENIRQSYITAIVLKELHPFFLAHYFDGLDNVNNGEYKDDGKVKGADIFTWDAQANELKVLLPDEQGNISPSRFDTYCLGASGFKKKTASSKVNINVTTTTTN